MNTTSSRFGPQAIAQINRIVVEQLQTLGIAPTPIAEEPTTLEKIWGNLFDHHGQPTARLGQFLRGLARHLSGDQETKVLKPKNMLEFYEATKIADEMIPWHNVFDEKSKISRMYRELRIQHHLVQEDTNFSYRPFIAALTAEGFERWQTLLIQAYPAQEFERLHKAVINMPISNPDDDSERFPKGITRALFPRDSQPDVRAILASAMETHTQVGVARYNDTLTPRKEQPGLLNQEQSRFTTANHVSQGYTGARRNLAPVAHHDSFPGQPSRQQRDPLPVTNRATYPSQYSSSFSGNKRRC